MNRQFADLALIDCNFGALDLDTATRLRAAPAVQIHLLGQWRPCPNPQFQPDELYRATPEELA